MSEEKIYTTEDTIRFLDVLEAENEEALTGLMEQMQEIEQKVREVDYALEELDQKPDSNMNFFSPVGVYEEGEEKRELLQVAEKLKDELPRLTEKMEQYRHLLLLYNIVYLQFQTLLKIFNLCFLVFDINFVPVFSL